MIDLHCHILPGVDDGAADLDEALAMARVCVADGITHITATPHCNQSIHLLRDEILPLVAEFNEDLEHAGIPLTILPGAEIQVNGSAAYRAEYEAGVLCHLGDRPAFTLLEFNWRPEAYPSDAVELVKWLRERGTTPIIAHPERHSFFQNDRPRLQRLIDAGAWLQVTVDSLLGNHGLVPRRVGEDLVRDYTAIVLASDAHNIRRCSGLSAGFEWVTRHVSRERADAFRARAAEVLAAITSK